MTTDIIIPSALLDAVARWALPEPPGRPHLSQVLFRDGEVVATDGIRLVRVPLETHGQTFGLRRCDALAAVAAQTTLLGPLRDHAIRIRVVAPGVLDLRFSVDERPVFRVAAVTGAFPPVEDLFASFTAATRGPTPDGLSFNPALLGAIHDVVEAQRAGDCGVQVTWWGGLTDPTVFEGPAGSRFVVMPMAPG